MRRTAALAACVTSAAGHGAVVYPPVRNAVEALQNVPAYTTEGLGSCPCANGTSSCHNANACYWFAQGCTIGCASCDGTPTKFKDLCGSKTKYTLSDPRARTFNRDAPAGSATDYTQHHPWRRPGSAPTFDPCGVAGGSFKTYSSDGAMYPGDWNHGASHPGPLTQYAKHGDKGSNLTGAPVQVWAPGQQVEVAWSIQFNHGGGYQYRLCPKSEALTEGCFQKMPLAFTGKQSLRFANGTLIDIPAVYVSEGTLPEGSTWAMNPIPARGRHANPGGGPGGSDLAFPPPCDEGGVDGLCSGDAARWPAQVGCQIVDRLQVPAALPAGEYVLGWRWDCEESAQVWSNCADIRIAKP